MEAKNVVLITSVLYTIGGSHPMSRSIFSHDERFEQTKQTILRARQYIPNAIIVFVECSPLRAEHEEFIKSNVDYFYNLWFSVDKAKMFTASKALGEGTQTIYALNQILSENIEFDNLFKISGRYFLDERFDYGKWNNDNIVIKEWNEAKSVFTFLYKMPRRMVEDWRAHLLGNYDNMIRNIGYEVIYGNFVEKYAQSVVFIDVMGIEGYISPSGSRVYI
jgi:hypothetical protein